jgi:protease-4
LQKILFRNRVFEIEFIDFLVELTSFLVRSLILWIFNLITSFLRFLKNYFKSILLIVIIIFLFAPSEGSLLPPNLAKVYIKGEISNIDETLKELKDVYEDDKIKGLLVVIDSGGGAVDKSIELSDTIKLIRTKKPVVSYSAGTLASGSYYASIWSDLIISNRGSLVGSIGVIFDGINYRELADKIGVSSQVSKAGKYKESGTGSREWLPYEKEEIDKVTSDMYQIFISDVAKARELKVEESNKFADAHIFTARQALKVGLIDRVGILIDAENELVKMSGVSEAIWKEKDEVDKLFKELTASFLEEFSTAFDWRLR